MSRNVSKRSAKGRNLRMVWKRLRKNRAAMVSLAILSIIFILCLLAPVICPYTYIEMDYGNINGLPNAEHWLGCDNYGRDILTRLLYGGRYSILLGVSTALVGMYCGLVIGILIGFTGGKIDLIGMRIIDIWASIPGMLLAIVIATVLGAGFGNTVIALCVGSVPAGVRMVRAMCLKERSQEYLEAAVSINCSRAKIMFRHLMPNILSPMIVSTTMQVGGTIMAASGLAYIGLGVKPPTPEWGSMLADSRNSFLDYPHEMFFPGIAIVIVIICINLFGDGLRDALDPKLKT